MLQPRSITSMFNYPRVPQCRVLLNYLQRYFFCFSCAAWTMMWQPLEQMVATTRGKLRFSIREEMVNSEAVPLTPTDLLLQAISQGLAPNRRQLCWKFAWFCQGKLCLSRAWLMLEPWPEAPMGVSILPCGVPCFLPGSWTPEAYYIASSIVLMNYSHFSVRCSYPFASRSWSTALKPWRWVVVRRGRWLSLNLPVWLGCSVIMPVRHWRCPDPRKMTRFNHEAECTTCSW